jgi:hypothetical protein
LNEWEMVGAVFTGLGKKREDEIIGLAKMKGLKFEDWAVYGIYKVKLLS